MIYSMSTAMLYLIALAVGIVAGIYLPLNGRFSDQIGSPLLATAIFFTVGASTAIIAWLVVGEEGVDRLHRADWYLFGLGGISFAIILGATLLIPRMGPAAYFVCLVAGQVTAGLLLSHFGLLSPEVLPVTPLKIIGALAVVGGVLLIRYAEERQLRKIEMAQLRSETQIHDSRAACTNLANRADCSAGQP